jgi:hypothetical protein
MKVYIALIMLTFFAVSAAAQADTAGGSFTITPSPDLPAQVSAYLGISASGGATATCPSGQMVVGVAGSKVKFIQKITPVCGSMGKLTASLPAPLDPSALSVMPFTLQCTSGRVVTKVRVSWNANTSTYPYLGGVEISCVPWVVAQWSSEAPQILATGGFESWSAKASASCTSQMQPVRALRIRAPYWVKALSIICDEP